MAAERKILVVEDNAMNMLLVKEILSLSGYEVIEAASGAEAIEFFSSSKPDMVLMDINLPGMDGISAMRIIKGMAEGSLVPIFALTASAMKGEDAKIIGAGFDGYIAKPIDRKSMLNAIKSALG